jgi:hypothetical protein
MFAGIAGSQRQEKTPLCRVGRPHEPAKQVEPL